MRDWFAKYRKLWWAIGATVAATVIALSDPTSANGVLIEDGISLAELLTLAPMVAAAAVVRFAPEVPGARQAKSLCYLVIGLVAVLPSAAILDGISWTEGMMLGAYVLGYFGVRTSRNVGDLYDRLGGDEALPPARTRVNW